MMAGLIHGRQADWRILQAPLPFEKRDQIPRADSLQVA